MTVENQAPESKFAFVVIAARRARQLMSGAMPLVANPRSHKPTRVAVEEMGAGGLPNQFPFTPAQRQGGKRRHGEHAAPGPTVAPGGFGGRVASQDPHLVRGP